MSDLLSGLRTGAELDAAVFVPRAAPDFQAELLLLIDDGLCSVECLFADQGSWPECRCCCEGRTHGHGRTDDLTYVMRTDR